jgi:hypothetical protein
MVTATTVPPHDLRTERRKKLQISSSRTDTLSKSETWVNRKAFEDAGARCKTRQPTIEEVEEDRKKIS